MGPTITVVGPASTVPIPALAPYLTSAAREWDRPDTAKTHAQLLRRVRRFGLGTYAFLKAGETVEVPRVQLDRAEAMATLYRDLPVARAGALITSGMELMGRVVRDARLLEGVRDRSRPVIGHRVTHPERPAVWRAAVVALGLMGHPPVERDMDAARATGDALSRAAVMLAATLAGGDALAVVAQLRDGQADAFLTTCRVRLERGRLMTVVG